MDGLLARISHSLLDYHISGIDSIKDIIGRFSGVLLDMWTKSHGKTPEAASRAVFSTQKMINPLRQILEINRPPAAFGLVHAAQIVGQMQALCEIIKDVAYADMEHTTKLRFNDIFNRNTEQCYQR